MTKAKWLIYTVVLGLTPGLIRLLLASLATAQAAVPWIANADVVGFGLVVVITNINGLENAEGIEAAWKTMQLGLSLLLLICFATLSAASCFTEISPTTFDAWKLKLAAVVLSIAASLYSYSVWDRILTVRTAGGAR